MLLRWMRTRSSTRKKNTPRSRMILPKFSKQRSQDLWRNFRRRARAPSPCGSPRTPLELKMLVPRLLRLQRPCRRCATPRMPFANEDRHRRASPEARAPARLRTRRSPRARVMRRRRSQIEKGLRHARTVVRWATGAATPSAETSRPRTATRESEKATSQRWNWTATPMWSQFPSATSGWQLPTAQSRPSTPARV